jgi:hypothetical protein
LIKPHIIIAFILGEEVEFDVTGSAANQVSDQSEMSSLTAFIRHQATD